MSTTVSKTRIAEFANLFELFDKLATRRSRSTIITDAALDDIQSIPVPQDLQPVFRNLASLVGPRRRDRDRASKNDTANGDSTPKTRPRRNTVAVSPATFNKNNADANSDDSELSSDDESTAKFPLGEKQFPFTFRMMLHKLYELEEWGKKVKEVLEKSQTEYKSLSEVEKKLAEEEADLKAKEEEEEAKAAEEAKAEGRIRFSPGVPAPGGRRGSNAVRPRAISIAGPNRGKDIRRLPLSPISPKKPSLQIPQQPSATRDDTRAVKRRCVNRRKSLNGMQEGEEPQALGNWVYDSAVSSVDGTQPSRRRRISSTKPAPFAGSRVPSGPPRVLASRGRRSLSVSAANLLSKEN